MRRIRLRACLFGFVSAAWLACAQSSERAGGQRPVSPEVVPSPAPAASPAPVRAAGFRAMSLEGAPPGDGVWIGATPRAAVFKTGDALYRYDITADRWSRASSEGALTTFGEWQRIHATSEVYIVGRDGRAARYDLDLDRWRAAAPRPPAPAGRTLVGPYVSAEGSIYVLHQADDPGTPSILALYSHREDRFRTIPPLPRVVRRVAPISPGVACLDMMDAGEYVEPYATAPERFWFDETRFEWVRDALTGRARNHGGCRARITEDWAFQYYHFPHAVRGSVVEGTVSLTRVHRDRDTEEYCSTLPNTGPAGPGSPIAFGQCLLLFNPPLDWHGRRFVGGRVCCMDAQEAWSCAPAPESPRALDGRSFQSIWTGEELLIYGGLRMHRLPSPTFETDEGQVGFRRGEPVLDGFVFRPAPVTEGTGVPMTRCDASGNSLEPRP